MLMLSLCFLLVHALSPSISPVWLETERWNYKEECQIEGRAFTGVRLMKVRHIEFPSMTPLRKELILLNCDRGHPKYNVTLDPGTVFNSTIDTGYQLDSDGITYNNKVRVSRRPQYIELDRQGLRYLPGTVVGGVFTSTSPVVSDSNEDTKEPNRTAWSPFSPLIGDNWSRISRHYGINNTTAEVVIIVSLLRSPDVLDKTFPRNSDWVDFIPAYE